MSNGRQEYILRLLNTIDSLLSSIPISSSQKRSLQDLQTGERKLTVKFATLRTGEVVALTKEGYRRVNRSSMVDLIENYPSELTFSGDPIELPDTLAPPIAKPSKIWAAA